MQKTMKEWLTRILSVLSVRVRKIFFWVSFVVLALGVPWCAGAFFHAFDIPVFVSWCGVILLLASLIASLFFRWALLGTLLIEVLLTAVFCLINPEERFQHTLWQTPWRHTLEVTLLSAFL